MNKWIVQFLKPDGVKIELYMHMEQRYMFAICDGVRYNFVDHIWPVVEEEDGDAEVEDETGCGSEVHAFIESMVTGHLDAPEITYTDDGDNDVVAVMNMGHMVSRPGIIDFIR